MPQRQPIPAGFYGDYYGSQPSTFQFKGSQLQPNPSAVPVTGTSAYGAPGLAGPQTSNISASMPSAQNTAIAQVNQGPWGQPAFVAFVTMAIGVFILAVVAHVEV